MKTLVNGKETELSENATIATLTAQLQTPEKGVAIAVNNQMISRQEWSSYRLNENDTIVIVKAACGG